jgi:phosphoglucomutase
MGRAQELLELWSERATDQEIASELTALASKGDEAAIEDAFFQDLAFGTAGLRGIIGAGTNRMNIYTVGRATQGLCDYLNAIFEHPTVAIGRDSRNKGEQFVRCAAQIFAANGVKAYLYPRIQPVPALSFAVRDLKCTAGVCVTASHNPAPYNGYKVYGSDGCQITTQASKDISAAIQDVDTFEGVKSIDFDTACDSGLIEWIGEDTLDRYIDAVFAQSAEMPDAGQAAPLKLVYTPLNGSGLECVSRILKKVGITDVTVVPEQAEPNGDFPTCPYPNPEIREALERGIALCEEVKPDLLLATDPDADRVGTAVKNGGDYVLLSGNEMGVLLLDYLAKVKQAKGEALSDKYAVSTIVSSMMIDSLANEYGFTVKRVLTGFKYIGEFIGQLEQRGEESRFLFGFEESYGYLNGVHVRDKDAVDASMLICQMAQYYKQQGMNLAQAIQALYEKHGFYRNKTVSYSYPGADGNARMAAIMAGLRSDSPKEIAGVPVVGVVDYQEGVDGLPAANVVEFQLEGGDKVIIRPSGTEPKIKAYLFAKGATDKAAEEIIAKYDKGAAALLD